MLPVGILLALLVFLSVSGTAWLVWRLAQGQAGVVQSRLEAYASRNRSANATPQKEKKTVAVGLDRALRKRSYGQKLADDLTKADLQLRVSEFIALSVLCAVLVVLIVLILSNTPVLALFFGIIGYLLPRFYLKRRHGARLKTFNAQLGDAIRLLVSSLRSGYSMLQAMNVVATELPDPIATEFSRVVREIGLGLSSEDAFNNMLQRVESDDLDMMVTAINVQHEVGGNLAEILDTISTTIAERVRIQGEIKVLTAQQMLSGYLLIGLPFAVAFLLYIINRPYMVQLFEDICGLFMIGLSLLMISLGYLIIRKIIQIQV